MRVGIVSTNAVQKSIAIELLEPLVGQITSYDLSHAKSGELEATTVHFLIVDLGDPALHTCDEVMELVATTDICLLHEKDLFKMSTEERIAWRNKTIEAFITARPDLEADLSSKKDEADNKHVPDIWIIGSSAGGPQALKEMLTELPSLPIAIFIAQHISEAAYGQILNRVRDVAPNWNVHSAADGMVVEKGAIYMIPRDSTVEVKGGAIRLKTSTPRELQFNPNIDSLIRSVFATHNRLGVVILSGMGMDGSAGIRGIKGKAKLILAQEEISCGAKGMPDAARKTGAVNLSATPAELGRHLVKLYI